jgi:hypothetical protein
MIGPLLTFAQSRRGREDRGREDGGSGKLKPHNLAEFEIVMLLFLFHCFVGSHNLRFHKIFAYRTATRQTLKNL